MRPKEEDANFYAFVLKKSGPPAGLVYNAANIGYN
jgi:hypothetical protein